jgi:hypothetical protein
MISGMYIYGTPPPPDLNTNLEDIMDVLMKQVSTI